MICLEENKDWFSINKILESYNINNSHVYLINSVFNNLDKASILFITSSNQKN